ncbi:hypothetical protein VaNZ11_004310 [Volvox africanus]|uniref:Anaphase-promoting complex subunit 1 C-terminal domain-containing protein n=1 Tax=Volvox africanus TaxID=51714 RepID=A0ABQ5RW98_9CHLO|nr:hypothetical protein VaNZ11_004310 [Volvox africanus]
MLNLSITSPAATVALALMYLRTNNAAIAGRFQLPDTPFGLDCVRPDCITLRALGRALVMWDAIEPSEDWVEMNMAPLFRGPLERLVDRVVAQLHGAAMGGPTGRARGVGDGLRGGGGSYHSSDVHAVALAHVSALSGLCLAMGLKYAGSANSRAYETLRWVALALLAAKRRLPEVAASSTASGGAAVVTGAGQVSGGGAAAVGRLDRAPLEAALNVVVLALSVVMAGTGHLPTFHLLQALSNRRHPTHHHVLHSLGVGYGAHCAVSLALGFLFLGAGTHTFSTTNSSVAALLVALFPTLPHTPTDNRCHLQVFRHLYVLAARRRCLEAVDIDSQQLVYVPLQLTVTPPRVASPSVPAVSTAAAARGNGPTGQGSGADGGTDGDGVAGGDVMLDDNTVLKASTKANLPWSPDAHLRSSIGHAGVPPIMGTGSAAGATASGAPGSPPMLEALHLEGDSPGLASLLRAATTAAGTTGHAAGAAVPKSSPGAVGAMGSPHVPDSIRVGTSCAATPPFMNTACGLAAAGTGQPAAGQSQQLAVENGQVITYERVAPALLPEPHQTIRVAVRGPRYWPQQLDWSSRGTTGIDGTSAAASYSMAASASAAPFFRSNSISSEGPPAAAGPGGLAASAPSQTPYGQFPFATPLRVGGAWAECNMNVAGLRAAPPPASGVAAALPTSLPQAATAGDPFHNTARGARAPTAATAGGCSALETVYRQLLLFVKKRAGSLSYSQDPSGIRSLLSRAFYNQGLLRMPLEHSPPCTGTGTRSRTAVVAGGAEAATPLNVAGVAGVSPNSGGGAIFGARRQLDWCTDRHGDRRAASLGPYSPPCGGSAGNGGGGGGGGGEVMEPPPLIEGQHERDQCRADREDDQTEGSGSGGGNAARAAAGCAPTGIGDGDRTRGGGGFDLVHLCATFSVDPSIMAFAQHIKAMRDLWIAVEADTEAAFESGNVTAGGFRRGIVLLAPVSATPPAQGIDVEQQRRLSQWQRRQRRRHGADLLSFCYSALYECITGEKTAALPMYLNLHCLVHQAASWSSPCAQLGKGRFRPLSHGLLGAIGTAGCRSDPWRISVASAEGPMHPGSLLTEGQVPLTTALRGLQLARAYYSGPLAAAAAAAAAAPAGDVFVDLDEQALWRPLMQPAFLDSLWCTLQHRRWRPMGLLPPQGAATNIAPSVVSAAAAAGRVGCSSSSSSSSSRSGSALEVYLRRGRTLRSVDFDCVVPGLSQLASEAELQADLAACLALHGLPPLATVIAALSQLRALPAWQQVRGMLQPATLPTTGGSGAIGLVGIGAGGGGLGVRSSWALLPLLSLVMPGLSNEVLLLLAAAITT